MSETPEILPPAIPEVPTSPVAELVASEAYQTVKAQIEALYAEHYTEAFAVHLNAIRVGMANL